MRLILLPISTRRTLIYAHRLSPPPAAQTSLADRVTARAAAQWRKWEAAEKGWQRKVTGWGNAAFARIPFQEWGLKSVPPLSAKQKQANRDDGKSTRVDVIFPPNVLRPEEVEGTLWRLATERQGLHRRSMWWSIAGFPITLPVGLIPIIPNLPFFYLAFRAWSHWKALAGSQHIEYLIEQQSLRLRPSMILQHVYNLKTVSQDRLQELKSLTASDKPDGVHEEDAEERDDTVLVFLERTEMDTENVVSASHEEIAGRERLLLERASGKLLSRSIGVPGIDVEVERAVDQVTRLIAAEEAPAGGTETQGNGNATKEKRS